MKGIWKWLITIFASVSVIAGLAACGSTQDNSSPSDSPNASATGDPSTEEKKYTVTFKADGETVGTVQFTEEDETVTEPQVPAKAHYTGKWEAYTLGNGDITVNAVYTAIEYTVTFMDGEKTVATETYTVENTDITVPELPTKDHYTSSWEAYDLNGGNITVNVSYNPIAYTITFMNGEELVEAVSFNVESTDKKAPAIPEMKGYTGTWSAYDFTKLENQTVTLSYDPNTYTITYNAKGGTVDSETQSVVYDGEYTLFAATPAKSYQEFLGWVDEDGNAVTDGEKWGIDSDITLTAVYSKGMTFESLTAVPAAMWVSGNAGTASVGEKNGNKCLIIPITGSAPELHVTTAFLAEFFADPNVQYVGFDAMTDSMSNSNFRRYTMKADNSGLDKVTYEYNNAVYGVTAGEWKSFYFTRADYEVWVANNFTENLFIATGGFSSGDTLYVDNIRPVTAQEYMDDACGFETGYMKLSSTNLLAYFGTSMDWQLGIGFNAAANQPSAYGLTDEYASQGRKSLYFTKPAGTGDYTVRLNAAAHTAMKSTGYYAFDLYIPEGADTTLIGTSTWTIATPKAGEWVTVYVASTNNKPVNIHDTTGGTYAIDHFRSVTAEEFNAAMYGFEPGAGALRDVTGSENRFYYYAGADEHTTKKVSWNVKGDGSTISNVRLDTENVHSGNFALAFEKTDGYAYMSMSTESTLHAALKGGFTFWIYSTVALNGEGDANNFINGNNEKFGEEGVLIPANTWVQVTITAEDINDSGRFLILNGSTAGTIYIDDICPLPTSAE